MGLVAFWSGWWLLGALFGLGGVVLGIYELTHREEVWVRRQRQLPQEWIERHGSKWIVQEGLVGILGGLMILVVSLVRFLTE